MLTVRRIAFIASVAWFVMTHRNSEVGIRCQIATCIFNIFFWCISAKMSKLGLKTKKSFVEIKPVSVVEHVEI